MREYKSVLIRLFIIATLLGFSVACYYGLQDTVATGKAVFGMTEDTRLKWYKYLYIAMSLGVFSWATIPLLITSGWIRELLASILFIVMLISSLGAYHDLSLDALRYLEPSSYQHTAPKQQYLARAVLPVQTDTLRPQPVKPHRPSRGKPRDT